MKVYIYIIIMALVTYLIRSIPLICMNKNIENRFIKSFLHYVPYTCLAAMTIPTIFYATESIISSIFGFVVALFFAYRERNLIFVATAGCFTVFVAECIISYI